MCVLESLGGVCSRACNSAALLDTMRVVGMIGSKHVVETGILGEISIFHEKRDIFG